MPSESRYALSRVNRAIQRDSHHTREIELLLRCARTTPSTPVVERVRQLLSGPLRWEEVVRLAQLHRIIPLLHRTLSHVDWTGVPGQVRSELHSVQQANAATCLRLSSELMRLLRVFEQAGIRAVPFKGVTLAARAYGDVALRDAGDIDLLVRREDIGRAVGLLEGAGMRPAFPTSTPREADYLCSLKGPRRDAYLGSHCEHHLVSEAAALNVDLHWAIALREFSLALDVQGLWNRATVNEFIGRKVPALCDEDLLLVLCVNGAKDCWERLDRVCDVAELIRAAPRMQWDRVIGLAESSGAKRILGLGLSLASELLQIDLPPRASAFVEEDRQLPRLTRRVRDRLFEDPRPSQDMRPGRALFHLNLRERWRDRAQYCAAQLRPGVGDWAAVRLPPGFGFLYYVIRPFRLAGRYLLKRQATPPAGPSAS